MSVGVGVVAEHYFAGLATRARSRTIKESRAILERVIHELAVQTVGEITRARVKAWRNARIAAGASNKTVNNQLAVLVAALACAVEDELIDSHPLAGLTMLPVGPRHQRRRSRALAELEIAQLLAAMAEADANPEVRPGSCPEWLTISEAADLARVSWEAIAHRAARDGWTTGTLVRGRRVRAVRSADVLAAYAPRERVPQELLVRVLLETGARWGELVTTTWADVDTAGASLIFRADNTKTGQERCVPLRRDTCDELAQYRLTCARVLGSMPSAAAQVWLSPMGAPWRRDASTFRARVLGPAYERAGLLVRDERGRLRSLGGHALNVHTLRHTCCTRLLSAGVPVPMVQALLGHASPDMTLRVYWTMGARRARDLIQRLPAPGEGPRS